MKIKLLNKYGNIKFDSYYKKVGIYCFEFTYDKHSATDLTEDEANKILESKDWYLTYFGGKDMELVPSELSM